MNITSGTNKKLRIILEIALLYPSTVKNTVKTVASTGYRPAGLAKARNNRSRPLRSNVVSMCVSASNVYWLPISMLLLLLFTFI